MFSKLYNEAVIEFDMHTESPLFIKSSDENQLNPASVEHTFFVTYKNGELVPAIPGSSLKGVFRSTAEQILKEHGVCDILSKNNSCSTRITNEEKQNKNDGLKKPLGKSRYEKSCPVCKEELQPEKSLAAVDLSKTSFSKDNTEFSKSGLDFLSGISEIFMDGIYNLRE